MSDSNTSGWRSKITRRRPNLDGVNKNGQKPTHDEKTIQLSAASLGSKLIKSIHRIDPSICVPCINIIDALAVAVH